MGKCATYRYGDGWGTRVDGCCYHSEPLIDTRGHDTNFLRQISEIETLRHYDVTAELCCCCGQIRPKHFNHHLKSQGG